jgi:CBS domain-containing membrane protein
VIATQRTSRGVKARDLMREVVVTVPQQMTLSGAARLLAQAETSVIPVTDAQGRCVGVLSASTLVPWATNGCRSEMRSRPPPNCAWSDWQVLEDAESPEDEVRHHMKAASPMVAPETPLPELVHVMAEADAQRVIVVDARHRPLGMVSAADVLTAAYADKKDLRRPLYEIKNIERL